MTDTLTIPSNRILSFFMVINRESSGWDINLTLRGEVEKKIVFYFILLYVPVV